jgi:hypothetical protein
MPAAVPAGRETNVSLEREPEANLPDALFTVPDIASLGSWLQDRRVGERIGDVP